MSKATKEQVLGRSCKQLALLCCSLFLFLLCSGCAQMYTGLQAIGAESCYKLPYPDQQDCLEQMTMSHEEYEENREKGKQI